MKLPSLPPYQILLLLWGVGALVDRLWLGLDNAMPAWDQADYLNGAMNYWQMFQSGDRFSQAWWSQFWLMSPKIPPLAYVLTVPFLQGFGLGADQALLVQLLFSGILLAAVYGLGVRLFWPGLGLWAAGLCVLLPGLYRLRLEYLLDYPLAAMVTASFWALTVWWQTRQRGKSWLWAIAAGLLLGLAILVKQSALLFLLVPLGWTGLQALWGRRWERLAQWGLLTLTTFNTVRPWVSTNWLLMLTSSKRATLDSAVKEGDPSLLSWQAWTYYLSQLPHYLSWGWLLLPLMGLLYLALRRWRDWQKAAPWRSLGWVMLFVAGSYVLSSLNPNKDGRYWIPALPVLSLLLAYGLLQWRTQGRWVAVALGTVSLLLNLFPLGGEAIAQVLSPQGLHRLQFGLKWPHPAVVETIATAEPYLQSTLGVLPSTGAINQHNFSFFGAQAHFHVFGRQVGVRDKDIPQDLRSLNWFVLKTGDQGSIPRSQPAMVQAVRTSPNFQLEQSWPMPPEPNQPESQLQLYRRRQPWVEVQPRSPHGEPVAAVRLETVDIPAQAPPNQPVPVTYRWAGPAQDLREGIVLLTWHKLDSDEHWLHDHAIGLGFLRSPTASQPSLTTDNPALEVTERLAMLPTASPGRYQLQARYLNKRTGETAPIALPTTILNLQPQAAPTPAPELDWLTQLRQWSSKLPAGPDAVGPAFEEIARVNQYDPRQDYVNQAALSLGYRLQQEPDNKELAYAYALAKALQQDVPGAIAALRTVTILDANNPYAHAYLAFVYLYGLQPGAAAVALQPAQALTPSLREVRVLDGVAGVMRGRVWRLGEVIRGLGGS